MAIRNVVFDLDGTLVDSANDILDALRMAAEEAGIDSSIPLTTAVIGPPVRGMLSAWGAEFTEDQALIAVAAFRRIYDRSAMPRTAPYPGAIDCVKQIAGRSRLFVATNKPELPTVGLLDRYFPGLFDDHICTNSLADRKLDKAEMLQELAGRHRLAAQESVMVGDGESDLRAGKQLGWRTIAALYGYGSKESLLAEQPDWAVASTEEIAALLLK